jgi:S-formylglutathione hydrolase FrmB
MPGVHRSRLSLGTVAEPMPYQRGGTQPAGSFGGAVTEAPRSTRLAATGASALLALALAMAALPSKSAAAPRFGSADGLQVVSQRQLGPRLLEATVKTAALPGPANVRILLPRGYAANPGRRYPVLYLLHGTSGGASDWTTMGDAQKTTAGLPLIVVMPDIALNRDGGGWCTNWPNGPYDWETFHVDQLVPWVDTNLRTRRARGERAIAGLSQGGFCSMSYAARHPDLFGIALSYSGAPDIYYDADARAGSIAVINATEVGLDHVPPNSMFGDPVTDGINWAAHDPATLAQNLQATRMYLFTGNGEPGPLDPPNPDAGATAIEAAAHRSTAKFHERLDALGIPSHYDDYGPGTHTWPYWARDLGQSVGPLMAAFKHRAPEPRGITYQSADNAYSVYGWRVRVHRTAREFSYLRHAHCRRFVLAGSGSATVTTPSCLKPKGRYRVRLRGDHVTRRLQVRASRSGRLRLHVPLGPPNPYQQYTAQAEAAGTAVYRTRVAVRPQ